MHSHMQSRIGSRIGSRIDSRAVSRAVSVPIRTSHNDPPAPVAASVVLEICSRVVLAYEEISTEGTMTSARQVIFSGHEIMNCCAMLEVATNFPRGELRSMLAELVEGEIQKKTQKKERDGFCVKVNVNPERITEIKFFVLTSNGVDEDEDGKEKTYDERYKPSLLFEIRLTGGGGYNYVSGATNVPVSDALVKGHHFGAPDIKTSINKILDNVFSCLVALKTPQEEGFDRILFLPGKLIVSVAGLAVLRAKVKQEDTTQVDKEYKDLGDAVNSTRCSVVHSAAKPKRRNSSTKAIAKELHEAALHTRGELAEHTRAMDEDDAEPIPPANSSRLNLQAWRRRVTPSRRNAMIGGVAALSTAAVAAGLKHYLGNQGGSGNQQPIQRTESHQKSTDHLQQQLGAESHGDS